MDFGWLRSFDVIDHSFNFILVDPDVFINVPLKFYLIKF